MELVKDTNEFCLRTTLGIFTSKDENIHRFAVRGEKIQGNRDRKREKYNVHQRDLEKETEKKKRNLIHRERDIH